ncbi:MAG TPA: phosphopantetheine-binding protein [Smithellaceae bacterium]|nr:phosphopantetheine-binding protein [Smithellaceae bacterium]
MTQQEAINSITLALRKVLKRDGFEISIDTDLSDKKILDSLDRIVFLMELSELTGKEFSEDVDLVKIGLFKVANLADYLTGARDINQFFPNV